MLVFREGRRPVPGPALCEQFRASLEQLAQRSPADNILDPLLRAGELECTLADSESPHTDSVAAITDALSAALLTGRPAALHWAGDVDFPEHLTVSRPEGFAYYALHPLDYAEAADRLPSADRELAVIGIRSIGTTLSAVVTAAARKHTRARRITVRPKGHPFDRELQFSPIERQWIECADRAGSHFVVVDEGPGLSGSSFLAVAEALVRAGIPENRITLLGSTKPDLQALRAPRAAQRWAPFRLLTVQPPSRKPKKASIPIGEGKWREFVPPRSPVPASWICFERQKYLSSDRRLLFKFEGLGPYGNDVLQRARALADAGFSPAVSAAGDGFLAYDWLIGNPPNPRTVTTAQLDRIAEYCAWRVGNFAGRSATPLETMLLTNLKEEFGDAARHVSADLEYRRLAVVDGRMQPHEWLLTPGVALMKLDSATHGDDHFFPGPTDIAWDLAGAIIEWGLSSAAADYLIGRYARLAGDNARPRLAAYLLAYTMFRLGYCRLAAESLSGSKDAARFLREADYYRGFAIAQLRLVPPSLRSRCGILQVVNPQAIAARPRE